MLIKRKSIEHAESTPRQPAKPVKPAKPKYAPVTLSEQDGIRYLHFGTEWVQGAMRLSRPFWLELEYSQQLMAWMLFLPEPESIVQLGLGTGALTKFCYREFPKAKVSAIELNNAVITIAEAMFRLPPNDERLTVTEMDAWDFVTDPANHGQIDVLQVDLYDAAARGPVLDTPEFYQACRACLTADGIMAVNLFGDHPSYGKNIKAMKFAFEQVVSLPEIHDGNVIALAFARHTAFDWEALEARAKEIKTATRLPTASWIKALKIATQQL
jgi:spermidine synthase